MDELERLCKAFCILGICIFIIIIIERCIVPRTAWNNTAFTGAQERTGIGTLPGMGGSCIRAKSEERVGGKEVLATIIQKVI